MEFVRIAWENSIKNSWERTHRSRTVKFVQALKKHPRFAELELNELFPELDPLIQLSDEDKYAIADEWDFVKGISILEWAAGMARQRPLKHRWPGLDDWLYQLFVSTAAHLQVMRGNKPIQLPLERVAKALFTTPANVSRMRKIATRYGLLTQVAAASYVRHLATDFKFAVERFPDELKERH